MKEGRLARGTEPLCGGFVTDGARSYTIPQLAHL
jgi:hypothetical protein